MGSGAVSFQGCQKADPINSVVRLLELQEYQEKRILVNDIQILCQLKLQDSCTHSPTCEESMEDVVEADTCTLAGVSYRLHHLPKRLQKANLLGVSVTLGHQE